MTTYIDKKDLLAIARAYLPMCSTCGRVATSTATSYRMELLVCDDHRTEPYTLLREATALRAIQQALDAGPSGYTRTHENGIPGCAWADCRGCHVCRGTR